MRRPPVDLKRKVDHPTEDDIDMATRHKERWWTQLHIRKILIEIIQRKHYRPTRMAAMKTPDMPSAGKDAMHSVLEVAATTKAQCPILVTQQFRSWVDTKETCSPKDVSECSLAPSLRLREMNVLHLSVCSPLPVSGQTWPWLPEEPETSNFKAPWLPLPVGILHWLGQRTLSPFPKGTPWPNVAPPGSG